MGYVIEQAPVPLSRDNAMVRRELLNVVEQFGQHLSERRDEDHSQLQTLKTKAAYDAWSARVFHRV